VRELIRRLDRLQALAVFEAAARLGSFTAAGHELGLSQPAVTRQIRALERRLGVSLFVRTANRSRLSDPGRNLRDHVATAFDIVEAGLAELDEHTGTFVLAAHPGVAQAWVVPRLDQINEVLGDLDLRLWLFDRDAELADGAFDAAVRVGDGDFSGHDARLLFPEVVVPVAAPAVAREHGLNADSTATDVQRAPLIHMDDGDRPWMTWAGWFDTFDLALTRSPGRVLFHNYPMVLQRALLGHGIALGWRPLIDAYLEGDALEIVGPEVRSDRGYYVTWPAGRKTAAVTALTKWFVAAAAG
jgi:LysR family transcriptional regulator, glycine cleavage system transcriptional activator